MRFDSADRAKCTAVWLFSKNQPFLFEADDPNHLLEWLKQYVEKGLLTCKEERQGPQSYLRFEPVEGMATEWTRIWKVRTAIRKL